MSVADSNPVRPMMCKVTFDASVTLRARRCPKSTDLLLVSVTMVAVGKIRSNTPGDSATIACLVLRVMRCRCCPSQQRPCATPLPSR